jgi:hypothetical protein
MEAASSVPSAPASRRASGIRPRSRSSGTTPASRARRLRATNALCRQLGSRCSPQRRVSAEPCVRRRSLSSRECPESSRLHRRRRSRPDRPGSGRGRTIGFAQEQRSRERRSARLSSRASAGPTSRGSRAIPDSCFVQPRELSDVSIARLHTLERVRFRDCSGDRTVAIGVVRFGSAQIAKAVAPTCAVSAEARETLSTEQMP